MIFFIPHAIKCRCWCQTHWRPSRPMQADAACTSSTSIEKVQARHTSSQWIARKQLQRIAYIHKDVHKDIQSHAHLSLCAHFHSLACAKIVGFLTYPIWTNLPNLSTLWKYIPEICLGLLNLQFQMSQQPQIQKVSGNTRCCSWTRKASIQPDLLIVELQVEAQLNIGPIPPS